MTKSPAVRFLQPEGLAVSPNYTQVVEVRGGRTAYLSGQIAVDADGKVVGADDFEAQARQVFENLRIALTAVGMDFGHVIKLNLYLTDMSHLPDMSRVRAEYVRNNPPPASTLVQVAALAYPGLLFEAEAIAVTEDD